MAVDTEPATANGKPTSNAHPGLISRDQKVDERIGPESNALSLTPAQLQSWQDDGYLILPGQISPEDVSVLLKEAHRMLEEDFELKDHPMTKFSTGTDDSGRKEGHVGDDYFLTSGDKIRFFFEEGAFDEAGNLTKPKEAAINKIGHSLHTLSPPYRKLSLSQQIVSIAKSLGFLQPKILQSMIICKQPEIGGAVPPHQDSTFLYTNPPSAVGFWYALEDATIENGCLSFLGGSHRWAPVEKRFVRKEERMDDGSFKATGTTFIDLDPGKGDAVFPRQSGDESIAAGNGEVRESEKEKEYTIRPVKAGDLVLIHGNLLHKSEANTSQKSRFIYTFHMIEVKEGWEYDRRNWLQPSEGGFTDLYADADAATSSSS